MLLQGLLDQQTVRLLLACAVSLVAHALLVVNLPSGFIEVPASPSLDKFRVSVDFPTTETSTLPETETPPPIPASIQTRPDTPPQPARQSPQAAPPIDAPVKRLAPVETLRQAWRPEHGQVQEKSSPIRLTDQPGLGADARAYLASWQREVQRIGRLNFPTDSEGRRLRGSLRVLVGIHMDGQLAYARVTESSGSARLDAAAIRIVELAAPFAPLPLTLRRGDAPLEIERTWRIGASLVQL